MPGHHPIHVALLICLGGQACAAGPPPVAVHTGLVRVGADRVYYERLGAGCPIVLVSGGSGMDLRQWDSITPHLARQFQVIRFDPRGLGRSSNPSESFRGAADLALVLDSLGISSVALVGLSAAGGAILEFALEYPDRVRGVVAAAAMIPGFPFSQPMVERLSAFTAAARRGRDPFLDLMLADPYFFPAPLHPAVRDSARRLMEEQFDKALGTDPTLARPLMPPLLSRLGEFRVPVLLPVGQLDHPEVRRRNQFIAGAIPRAMEVVIEASGHNIPLENPAAFLGQAEPFLRGVCRGSAATSP